MQQLQGLEMARVGDQPTLHVVPWGRMREGPNAWMILPGELRRSTKRRGVGNYAFVIDIVRNRSSKDQRARHVLEQTPDDGANVVIVMALSWPRPRAQCPVPYYSRGRHHILKWRRTSFTPHTTLYCLVQYIHDRGISPVSKG